MNSFGIESNEYLVAQHSCFLQTPLAKGQGGNEEEAIAHAQNVFDSLALMGNETITSRDVRLPGQNNPLESILASISQIQKDVANLKRKGSAELQSERPTKIARSDSFQMNDQSDSESEIDDLLRLRSENSQIENEEDEEWTDISTFFEEESDLGEDVASELADVVNRSLRTCPKKEKRKDLATKHRRPKNVKNLQVLKVDDMLWKQLRPQTKHCDYGMQQVQKHLCTALVPTIKLMHHMRHKGDAQTALELVGDIFKILTNGYVEANNARRDKIKNDLLPKYKQLCEEPASETKLFGDNLEDKVKKMKETTTTLTTTTNSRSFLFNRGGGINKLPINNRKRYNTSSGNYPPPVPKKAFQRQQHQYRQKAGKMNRK